MGSQLESVSTDFGQRPFIALKAARRPVSPDYKLRIGVLYSVVRGYGRHEGKTICQDSFTDSPESDFSEPKSRLQ